MSAFTTPADLRLLDRHHWELLAPFEYHAGAYPSAVVIRVPTGFVTDLASVPRLFWPIFPPHGRYAKAAILHDWLYAQGGDTADRLSADNIFGEAMQVLGVSAW
ncbi:MAG: DUF1353 domain-containing protein, partial [Rhodocyclaceae bacterium]|nr:DUF1353 domain-containing protein [Rhodocyclaceae bacterium]